MIDVIDCHCTDDTVYLPQDMKLYGENGNSATWIQDDLESLRFEPNPEQFGNKDVKNCRSKMKQEQEEDQTFTMSSTHQDTRNSRSFGRVVSDCFSGWTHHVWVPATASKEKMRIAVEAGITYQVEAESDSVVCVDLLKLTTTFYVRTS